MGQLVLLLVVVVIGLAGWFIGKLMDRRAAVVTGVICWCVTLATCHYGDTLHGLDAVLPLGGSFLFALLGLGLIIAGITESDPDAPLSEEDAKAAARAAARMERLRALEQSVPDYSQTQPGQTPSPGEPDPPTSLR